MTAVDVTNAVETVVVSSNVSNTVDVVVVVSVVNAVLFCVVRCVCWLVETTDWSTVAIEVMSAVAVMVIDCVLVFVGPFAVLIEVTTVVDVLMLSVKCINRVQQVWPRFVLHYLGPAAFHRTCLICLYSFTLQRNTVRHPIHP
jgi:hypothetical protein